MREVVLVLGRHADGVLPLVDELEDTTHHTPDDHRRPLGEAPNELIEKLFRANLQLDRIAAVLDQVVEHAQREQRLVRVARVDVHQEGLGGFASTEVSELVLTKELEEG